MTRNEITRLGLRDGGEKLDPVRAQFLLLKCRGDEIWDLETCRQERIPESWIAEMMDAFESGFDRDSNTIYYEGKMVNQYEGVHDLHLAYKLAEFLGIDWKRATSGIISRCGQVQALKLELDEL
ncbi:MAG: hypothetical protein AAF623_14480 [Planctomycetota bacterium]